MERNDAYCAVGTRIRNAGTSPINNINNALITLGLSRLGHFAIRRIMLQLPEQSMISPR